MGNKIPQCKDWKKTRFHQQGNPHLFGLNQDNFDLLAFISLNNDYSVHFVGIVKKDDLPPIDKQNRIIFSDKIKLVYPEKVKFQKHQQWKTPHNKQIGNRAGEVLLLSFCSMLNDSNSIQHLC